MKPQLKDKVNIGGSVGIIVELTSRYVKVQGRYRNTNGLSVPTYLTEPWVARFDLEQFDNTKWDVINEEWNMSKARIKSSY